MNDRTPEGVPAGVRLKPITQSTALHPRLWHPYQGAVRSAFIPEASLRSAPG